MKKLCFVLVIVFAAGGILQGCGSGKTPAVDSVPVVATPVPSIETPAPVEAPVPVDDPGTGTSEKTITAEKAYEGVSNYCHTEYDWSIAEENPEIMSVELGQETETEYQVIFRSYTGSFVYFYVDKSSGTTRMVEHVPAMNIEEEAGSINLFDYLQ